MSEKVLVVLYVFSGALVNPVGNTLSLFFVGTAFKLIEASVQFLLSAVTQEDSEY